MGELPTAYAMPQSGHQIDRIQRQSSQMTTSMQQQKRSGRECSRDFSCNGHFSVTEFVIAVELVDGTAEKCNSFKLLYKYYMHT